MPVWEHHQSWAMCHHHLPVLWGTCPEDGRGASVVGRPKWWATGPLSVPLNQHLWAGQLSPQSSAVAPHLSPETRGSQSTCLVHGIPPHSWGHSSRCHLSTIKLLAASAISCSTSPRHSCTIPGIGQVAHGTQVCRPLCVQGCVEGTPESSPAQHVLQPHPQEGSGATSCPSLTSYWGHPSSLCHDFSPCIVG